MRTLQHALRGSDVDNQTRRRPQGLAPAVEPLEGRRLLAGDVVLHWNEILLQSLTSQPPRVPLSRNMAMVHVAMFDAVNAIDRSHEPYAAEVKSSRGASMEAAAAQAARDTLVALYPSRQAGYDAALAEDLAGIPNGRARQGVAVGKEVARQILALRANDGAADVETYTPSDHDPGTWEPTPPDNSPPTSAHVPSVTPFATQSSAQFRPGPPPALDSRAYADAFNYVKEIGSLNSTVRTPDQTLVAMLYRLPLTNHQVWNRTAQTVARSEGNTLVENARMFALLNIGLHDGLQTSFASKFLYELWRPITAIRRAAEDGNDLTTADPNWMTLHPSTPPYPSYAGNASTIGAVCATVLAEFYGTDDIDFTVDWSPYGFPGVTRSYDGFWEAADEHARSREYGGIHFPFDSNAGQQIGRNVGEYVVDTVLEPTHHGRGHGDNNNNNNNNAQHGSATFGAAMGRGSVSVTSVPNATGTFSADIEVRLKGAAPNTTYTLQRAPEVGRPLGADGIFQRANGQYPWEQPNSPGFPPAPSFLTFVLPATATTPAAPVTITTNGGGNGKVRFHLDVPGVARGATFDVVFRAIDLSGVASAILSDGFQVIPQ